MQLNEDIIDQAHAEAKLRDILASVDMPVKVSYRPGEVCLILGITVPTFYNMTNRYEPGDDGEPRHPISLDSFSVGHRRVTFRELAKFIERNNIWRRDCNADPN